MIDMKLFTASVDSEDELEGVWNDLLYVAAQDEADAVEQARDWLRDNHPGRELLEEPEAHEYKGESKVLAPFDPNEED